MGGDYSKCDYFTEVYFIGNDDNSSNGLFHIK